MYGLTRGTMTLIGVAAAGLLLWLATQFGAENATEYWTATALFAAAGLTMAVSQLLGGWTKWGRPRISGTVFLLGFVPALVAGGLVLLHMQPDGGFGSAWAADLGLSGLADDLGGVLPAIAFLIGLTFGLVFDTAGPRLPDEYLQRDEVGAERGYAGPVPAGYGDADEPVTSERRYSGERTATNGRYAGPVPAHHDDADEPVTAERDEVASRHPVRSERRDEDETVVRDRGGDGEYVETGARRHRDGGAVDGDGRYGDRDADGSYDDVDGDRAEPRESRRRGLFRR